MAEKTSKLRVLAHAILEYVDGNQIKHLTGEVFEAAEKDAEKWLRLGVAEKAGNAKVDANPGAVTEEVPTVDEPPAGQPVEEPPPAA